MTIVHEVPVGYIEKKIYEESEWEITIIVWMLDAQAMVSSDRYKGWTRINWPF